MLLQHIDSLPGYEAFLRTNSRELRDLEEDALINVTRFFRDPEVFGTLKTVALPRIFDNRDAGQQVRVWVAGCSSGEEVYSLAICILEYLTGKPEEPSIQIFGTDASEQNIQRARAGVYPEAIAAEVSPERLRRFFFKTDKGYHVVKRVRDLCIFARQNLCYDPPFSRMDLISCRNVLIYFGSTLQRQIIPTFHYSLRQDGLLLLGSSEAIREFGDLFALLDRKGKIFTKIGSSATRPFADRLAPLFSPDLPGNTIPGEPTEQWGDLELQRAMDRIILARYGPPAVVINERLEILQSRGNTSSFFEIPQGTATFHLSRVTRPEIASQLMDVVRHAIDSDTSTQVDLVQVRDSDRKLQITIEVLPIHTVNVRPRCYLVLFIPAKQVGASDAELEAFAERTADEKSRIVGNLRQDLASTRLYLQSLLEERDARNQELVSANEEIQSSNEELQSTNEELETTKEELQSSNEELQTVNDELQNRNQVLMQASNDLSNLLNSVNMPVLMLSNELTIRHFTPPAQRWMNVRPSDIGRPFGEIRMNIEMDTLEPLLRDVLDTLTAREVEVRDRSGRWHLLRVRPYRTVDNRIEGLVIVLVDIDQLRRSQQELLEARDFARTVLECVPLPLVVTDLDYRIRTVNQAFCRLAHTPAADLDQRSLPDLAASLWGPDQSLRSHLADLRTAKDARKTFEFVQETSGEDLRVLQIRGSVLHPDGELFLLVTVEDITAHTEIERLLKEKGERLAVEVESATLELGRSREELRALTRSLFTSQEEERRRVARELHDDVSQRLALIEIHGEQTEREMEENPEFAHQKLRELRAKIGELSRDVRSISHRLHPATIEDLGLASALRSLTEEFRARERMITTFAQQDLPENIPTGLAIGLYRIAQEALRNVAKHAGQTHVKVSLRGGNNHLVLQVTDSGIGFDMEGARSGLGLISMQERARHLNAAFSIESMLGEGTKVTVDVPLDGSSDIAPGGGGEQIANATTRYCRDRGIGRRRGGASETGCPASGRLAGGCIRRAAHASPNPELSARHSEALRNLAGHASGGWRRDRTGKHLRRSARSSSGDRAGSHASEHGAERATPPPVY